LERISAPEKLAISNASCLLLQQCHRNIRKKHLSSASQDPEQRQGFKPGEPASSLLHIALVLRRGERSQELEQHALEKFFQDN
jgi:hypothetical protein